MVQNLPGGQIEPTFKIIFFLEKYEVGKSQTDVLRIFDLRWLRQKSKISKNHNK